MAAKWESIRMAAKKRRSAKGFKTLDDFLVEEGKLIEFQAIAVEEVRAWRALHLGHRAKLE